MKNKLSALVAVFVLAISFAACDEDSAVKDLTSDITKEYEDVYTENDVEAETEDIEAAVKNPVQTDETDAAETEADNQEAVLADESEDGGIENDTKDETSVSEPADEPEIITETPAVTKPEETTVLKAAPEPVVVPEPAVVPEPTVSEKPVTEPTVETVPEIVVTEPEPVISPEAVSETETVPVIIQQPVPEAVPESVPEPVPEAAPEAAVTDISQPTVSATADASNCDYVLNTNSMKMHYPSCGSVKTMKAENTSYFIGTRNEAIAQGYDPCGRCNP